MRHNHIASFAAAILCNCTVLAHAADPIYNTEVRSPNPASSSLLDKKLYVDFADSPAMTESLRKALSERGYTLVQNESDAEEKLIFRSRFKVAGKGLATVQGSLGDIVSAKAGVAPTDKDYSRQSVGIDHVAISAMATGGVSSVSVTDFGIWLTQKMGIAGRFNQFVTGDPRGFCLSDNCNKFSQFANITYTGSAFTYVNVTATHENIYLDKMVQHAMTTLLNTLPSKGGRPPSGTGTL